MYFANTVFKLWMLSKWMEFIITRALYLLDILTIVVAWMQMMMGKGRRLYDILELYFLFSITRFIFQPIGGITSA